MKVHDREKKLQQHYEKMGSLKKDNLTAFDYNLRNLEIACAKSYILPNSKVLDVGSGPGIACFEYAQISNDVKGIDYAQSMVSYAQEKLHLNHKELVNRLEFSEASVLDLPFKANSFDIITTHRVLIALLSWETQQKALEEITRCLNPNGLYLMFEATVEGLEVLNRMRRLFGLSEVSEGGNGDYDRLLFSEKALREFMEEHYDLVQIHSFGMYYFLTRILQPLFVAPEQPRYDHKLNDVAYEIAKKIPDFDSIGHLKGYVWKRKK